MPFKTIPPGSLKNDDKDESPEEGVLLPWADDPSGSYFYYECAIGVMLDSGIVVHHRLPQVNNLPDSLGSVLFDDPAMNQEAVKGVNLKSVDQYQDVVQRMGHSRYWFRMWGRAIRIGYKVPIPHIKTIGGVVAIPYDKNPQWAFNRLAPGGNMGGVPLWVAGWSLWYTTASPPTNNVIPVSDPSALLTSADFPNGNPILPKGIQVPLTTPDDDSRSAKKSNTGSITR